MRFPVLSHVASTKCHVEVSVRAGLGPSQGTRDSPASAEPIARLPAATALRQPRGRHERPTARARLVSRQEGRHVSADGRTRNPKLSGKASLDTGGKEAVLIEQREDLLAPQARPELPDAVVPATAVGSAHRSRSGIGNRASIPPLGVEQILVWSDAHLERTGRWPTAESGPIAEAPGETWKAVQMALAQGLRGLPGRWSLSRFLKHLGEDLESA